MSKSKISFSDRSFVNSVFEDVLTDYKPREFHSASLSRMIEALYESLEDSGQEVEILIHLPREMILELQNAKYITDILEPDQFYVCNFRKGETSNTFKPLLKIDSNHSFCRELLFFSFSQTLCSLVCAKMNSVSDDHDEITGNWRGLLSCDISAIRETMQVAAELLTKCDTDGKFKDWCDQTGKKYDNQDINCTGNLNCGKFITQFASSLDRTRIVREEEMRWIHYLSRIQEAVGWELDVEGLFTAMGSVLKDGLGFNYIELDIINEESQESKDIVIKRNETDYGGELLTLIIRQDKRAELLKAKKPLLLDDFSKLKEIFANALLIQYMSLKSGIIVPLRYLDHTNGLLKIFSCEAKQYNQNTVEWMEAVGRILSRSLRNVKMHTDLQRMATMDGLTNVYNRRFFTEQLTREYERALRYQSALSLIMIDIDNFKHYNDTNGHLLGDKVLAQVARITRMKVRGHDIVARYGGEEFVVILPETGLENGQIVAEKVREAIEKTPFKNEIKQPGGTLSISLGIATLTDSVNSANELLNRADIALYEAKRKGRNRCEVFSTHSE